MALLQEIKVPLLAVNDTSLTVAELGFAPAAAVKKGDIIMVLETSKTTYDVEAEADGYVQYLCEAGLDYEVNTAVARIYSEGSEAVLVAPAGARGAMTGVSGGAVTTRPDAGTEARDEGIPVSGDAGTRINGDAGMRRADGGVYGVQRVAGGSEGGVRRRRMGDREVRVWEGETVFSRAALRLMEEHGIGRTVFAGRDMVTGTDVREVIGGGTGVETFHSENRPSASQPLGNQPAGNRPSAKVPSTNLPVTIDPRVTIKRLATAKKREIEYLSDVQSSGLTSTINTYVDAEGIFVQINRGLQYLKDSLLPVIIYEASRLLVDFPLLNGYFTGDAAAVYKEVNPGFAIDIDKGLKVLKVAAAGEKSVMEIEAEILRLSGLYLDDALEVEQLSDITFTITDLSSEGVAFFRPLINKMNSSILGISAVDDKLQRLMLSLTFDHRMTEGKLAAKFLQELKERLESYRPKGARARQDIACFKCYKTLAEDLGGAGLVRCVTPEGKDGYICQSCLKGF